MDAAARLVGRVTVASASAASSHRAIALHSVPTAKVGEADRHIREMLRELVMLLALGFLDHATDPTLAALFESFVVRLPCGDGVRVSGIDGNAAQRNGHGVVRVDGKAATGSHGGPAVTVNDRLTDAILFQ